MKQPPIWKSWHEIKRSAWWPIFVREAKQAGRDAQEIARTKTPRFFDEWFRHKCITELW